MQLININEWRSRIFESDLTPKARLVALALAKYYRANKDCYPSYSTLREDTGYTNNHSIGDAIKELVENGFIKITKAKNKNISVQAQCYEFIGVPTSEVTGEATSELTSEFTGEFTSEVTGVQNELEIENKGNKGIITSQDKSCSDIKKKTKKEISEEVKNLFEKWWNIYPNKKSKPAALEKFNTLLAEKTVTFDELMKGAIGYSDEVDFEKTETKYIKHPTTWLNQGCWADEYKKHSYFYVEGID